MRIKSAFLVIIISGISLFLIGCGLYYWFQQPTSAQTNRGLSEKSKHRIVKMKEEGKISTTVRTTSEEGEVVTTECFIIKVPFLYNAVRTTTEDTGKCILRAQLSDPRGVFVVHTDYQPELLNLDENPSVVMREQDENYTAVSLPADQPNTLAFKSETELTIFSYRSPVLITLSLSELGSVDQKIISKAQAALDSFYLVTDE